MALDDQISFDQWIAYIFDHPVTDPAWHFDVDSDYWDGPPANIVAHLTRTFEECDTVLRSFSDSQVVEGFYFLISPACSNYAFTLLDSDVPLADRLHCIEAMVTLFERYFAVRCSPHLSHVIGAGAIPDDLSRLNEICYFWWELLPLHGLVKHQSEHPDAVKLDLAIIAALRRILALDSIACQESALFGLTNCALYYPEVHKEIVEFTARHRNPWERFKLAVRKTCFGKP